MPVDAALLELDESADGVLRDRRAESLGQAGDERGDRGFEVRPADRALEVDGSDGDAGPFADLERHVHDSA